MLPCFRFLYRGHLMRQPHADSCDCWLQTTRCRCSSGCSGFPACVGAKVTEETTLPAALLMNLIFLCGLFTFAVVLGFVSEEIKSQLRSVKAGNYAGMLLRNNVLTPCVCLTNVYSRCSWYVAAVLLMLSNVIEQLRPSLWFNHAACQQMVVLCLSYDVC